MCVCEGGGGGVVSLKWIISTRKLFHELIYINMQYNLKFSARRPAGLKLIICPHQLLQSPLWELNGGPLKGVGLLIHAVQTCCRSEAADDVRIWRHHNMSNMWSVSQHGVVTAYIDHCKQHVRQRVQTDTADLQTRVRDARNSPDNYSVSDRRWYNVAIFCILLGDYIVESWIPECTHLSIYPKSENGKISVLSDHNTAPFLHYL